jgi:hypothetical protein
LDLFEANYQNVQIPPPPPATKILRDSPNAGLR